MTSKKIKIIKKIAKEPENIIIIDNNDNDNGTKSEKINIVKKQMDVKIFNWTFDKSFIKTSIFYGLKMREYVDYNKVYSFIKENMGIEKYDNDWIKKINNAYNNDYEQLEKYKTCYHKNENFFRTSIILPKHKWGRIGQSDYLSLSIMRRGVRHALSIDNYIDIDMECAQPCIINEISKMNNYENKALNEYVKDPLKYRNEIMKYYNCKKDDAKNLIIRLLFGGCYNEWLKDNNIKKTQKIDFINEIECEIKKIIEVVYASNPEIKKDVLKINPNKWENIQAEKRGVMALWSQSIERLIQETAIMYLHKTKDFLLEDVVPCQDGFMILKKYWYDNILDDINNIIYETFNIKIIFKVKEFDEAIIIPLHNEEDDKQKIKQEKELSQQKIKDEKKTLEHQQKENEETDKQKIKYEKELLKIEQKKNKELEKLQHKKDKELEKLQQAKDKTIDKIKYQEDNLNKIKEENQKLINDQGYIEIKTDSDAKNHFIEEYKEVFIKSAGQIYIKDKNKWIASNDVKEMIFNMVMNIKYAKVNVFTGILYHYSGDTTGCRNITTAIYNSISSMDDPLFFNKISSSSVNHICFENGVYNMVDKVFYEWTEDYCKNIYTMVILPYNFNNVQIEDDINYVKENLFINVFGDERAVDFLKFLSRALSGNVLDKTFGIFTGERDCGKGVITENLQNTFFKYITNINTDNFLVKKNESNDVEKAKSWMDKCQYGRLAVGSEIKSDKTALFNGIMLKSFTGGDVQTIRKNNVDPFDIRISTTLLLMANDLPESNPKDAFLNHIRFKGQNSFMTEENIQKEVDKKMPEKYILSLKVAKPEIKNLCKDNEKYRDALLHLIINNYEKDKPKYSEKVLSETNDLKQDAEEDLNIIFENFEYVNDKDKILTDKDLTEFILKEGITCTKNKLKDRLLKYLVGVENYKNGKKPAGEGRGLKYIKYTEHKEEEIINK